MALGAEAEVALAQGLLSKACHALGRITRWKAALKLHVQVMEVQDVKTFPPQSGRVGRTGALAVRAVDWERGEGPEYVLTQRAAQQGQYHWFLMKLLLVSSLIQTTLLRKMRNQRIIFLSILPGTLHPELK